MAKRKKWNKRRAGAMMALTLALALFGAAGKPSEVWVISIATGMAFSLLYGFSDWVFKADLSIAEKYGRLVALLIAVGVGCSLYGWYFFPPIRRHVLNEEEKRRFEAPLKQQTEDRDEVQLACPAAEEVTCVYAAQFISIFKEAGWKVQGNQVQRVNLGIPFDGVRLFSYVDKYPDPDAPPNVGVWTKISKSLINIYRSFHAVAIEPEQGIRNDVKENVITVYFGSERQDESKPTELTRLYGQLPEVK